MPEDARGRYLAELAGVLPMRDDRRAETVEEIAAHLDDAVADRVERGADPDQAEADAQARLGSPTELARSLARPEQSPWRSLAGVGTALWSGTGHWIYGYLFASLVIILAVLAFSALIQAAGLLLDTGWTLQTSDGGWNTMFTAIAIGVGCYFAGRVLPDRFARASGHLKVDVMPWVLTVSVVLVAVMTVLVMEWPQNWASVVALVVAPLGLVLGAYRPSLLPGRTRFGLVAIVLALLVVSIVGVTVASTAGRDAPVEVPDFPDRGLSAIGPEWHPTADFAPALESSSWGERADGTGWEAMLASGVSLGEFDDLRLEAWASTDGGMRLDTGSDAPFAIAPVAERGRHLEATIDTTGEPGVTLWNLVLTGVADDGVRYVLDASMGGQSTFTGSAWDWIFAVATED